MNRAMMAVVALFLCGCRTEPNGLQWARDSVTAEHFALGAIEVRADGPVLVGALEANLVAAETALQGLGYTRAELDGVEAGLVITVSTGQRCLSGVESGQGPCVYAYAEYLGDAADWTPAAIALNQHGTQLAHELLHLLKGWRNEGGNADHSRWTDRDWQTVDAAADAAYRITPGA